MSILDGLVALGVIGAFFWIIFVGVASKNPGMMERMKEWFKDKPKEKLKEPMEKLQQVYDERRSIM